MAKLGKWILYIEVDNGSYGRLAGEQIPSSNYFAVCSSKEKAYEIAVRWAKKQGYYSTIGWDGMTNEEIIKENSGGMCIIPFPGMDRIHAIDWNKDWAGRLSLNQETYETASLDSDSADLQ